jgi:hypothetical protein
LRHFANLSIVAARSDWSGDESLLAFKCGPALGRQVTERLDYDVGAGRAHPDQELYATSGEVPLADISRKKPLEKNQGDPPIEKAVVEMAPV